MLGIPQAITAVSTMLDTAIERIWPDPIESEKLNIEKLRMAISRELTSMQGQLEANIQAAKHPSVFVAGARPFILWVCGGSLAYAALIEPILRFIASIVFGYTGVFPILNLDIITTTLFGLLGLSGYRMVEKIKGVSRETL